MPKLEPVSLLLVYCPKIAALFDMEERNLPKGDNSALIQVHGQVHRQRGRDLLKSCF